MVEKSAQAESSDSETDNTSHEVFEGLDMTPEIKGSHLEASQASADHSYCTTDVESQAETDPACLDDPGDGDEEGWSAGRRIIDLGMISKRHSIINHFTDSKSNIYFL